MADYTHNKKHVTYLGHSGFLVETEKAYYLFDYIRGNLPVLTEGKPIYVFASHFHEDHFDPIIFKGELRGKVSRYILSSDIQKRYKRRLPQWMKENEERILWIRRNMQVTIDAVSVYALQSTDIGVAFSIEEKSGSRIYHGGDLNWWHWEGEDKSWNRNMEVNYKREIDKLAGQTYDVAFLPLDPRLEGAYWYGMNYFLQKVQAKHVFPMHFWGEYKVIARYLKEHSLKGNADTRIYILKTEGLDYEI
ncbi:MAG: MBL fold metallo-hydrolase [Lachnospiraceae bacterium]|nr:MBL fold metallo-hydrolase [Lachnospiraceae bacterium]